MHPAQCRRFAPLELTRRGSLFLTRPTLFHYTAKASDLARGARELFEVVGEWEGEGAHRPDLCAHRCGEGAPRSRGAPHHRQHAPHSLMKVTVLPSRREFDARGDEPVLSAALRQHLNLPHSCKGGSCGTCRVRVLRGTFAYPYGRPIGIDAAEEEAGYALICQARATEDLVIEIHEIRNVTDVEIRELPARVERMERLAPDVMGLWLRLPAIEPFTWRSGQYVDVMLPGERRRSFRSPIRRTTPHSWNCTYDAHPAGNSAKEFSAG